MRTPTDYEKFVRQVVDELSGDGTTVHHRREFVGRVSGRTIVTDVSFDLSVVGSANVLVVVECKRYSERVEVADVEEFHSKIDDIGAHKGVMVTTVGYEAGAISTARGRGIALATLSDSPLPGEVDLHYIQASASIPGRPMRVDGPKGDPLLQGNLIPWGKVMGASGDEGFRFDSCSDLWLVMFLSLDE